jgi:surface antigen
MAQVLVVEADIGDVFAIGGNRGALVGAATIGERVQRVVREIDAIDLAIQGREIDIGAPVLGDQDRLAVRHEHRRALDDRSHRE